MHSISRKLIIAFILVVVISLGLMAYLTNLSAGREFRDYITQSNAIYIQNVATSLSSFYQQESNWDKVQPVLDGLQRSVNDRLLVADTSGRIVGDTSGTWVGKQVSQLGLTDGVNINVSDNNLGVLYLVISGVQVGRGGRGFMGGRNVNSPLSTGEQNFLSGFNNSLLIVGLISVTVALLLGILFTRQITRPIQSLIYGVRQISHGNLMHRVEDKSDDEIGELANSFNSMADSLAKGEQERRRIIADITHELRTPLTVIDGTVKAIKDGVYQPDNERMDVIIEQTQQLARLVSDLRDLSLADSGQLKLELIPTDVAGLISRKLAQFEVRAREKNIKLTLNVANRIPELMVDPYRLEQIMTNLLTNALRHTGQGGNITVNIRTMDSDTQHQTGKPSVLISVTDTGEGIAPEHLPHIFERFYRVDPSRSRNDGGAGLGLAIVKQMVQVHGGKVWVESKVGQGSTFFVTFPINEG